MIALSALLAATVIPVCTWTDRGQEKFVGSVPAAVDTYTHIPEPTRKRLQARMAKHEYDDIATITGSGIRSKNWRYADMRLMHFGNGSKLCGHVKTDHWAPSDKGEVGLVYCEQAEGAEHCIIVPTVCRNVSVTARVEKIQPPKQMVALSAPPIDEVTAPDSFLDLTMNPRRFTLAFVPGDSETAKPSPDTFAGVPWESRSWEPLPASPFASSMTPNIPVALDIYTFEPLRPLPPANGGGAGGGAGSAVGIDGGYEGTAIPVLPVPEPSVYGMMALGLGLVAWMARRKRTRG